MKLAAMTGLLLGWLGWPTVVLGTVSAFLLAAVVAVVFLVRERHAHHTWLSGRRSSPAPL